MELACPSCAAHFSVPDTAIGPKGRKLKCSACGHVWRQMPLGEESVASPAPAVAAPSLAPNTAAATTSGKDVVGEPLPPVGSVPLEMEPGQSLPDTAAPQTRPAPAPAARAAAPDDFLSPLDDDPFESFSSADSGGADPLDGLTLSDGASGDDLDSFAMDSEGDSDSDLDDLLSGDPDPIPAMFSRDDDDDRPHGAAKGKRLGTILVVVVVLMGLLGGGAWLFRDRLVDTVPALEGVFALMGIDAAPLGHGLIFRDVTSDLIDQGSAQVLIVRGLIVNHSDRDRPVPFLRLALFDRTGAMLEDIVAEPPQVLMDAGETVGFRIQADNPSAATHRFTVDWTAPPAR